MSDVQKEESNRAVSSQGSEEIIRQHVAFSMIAGMIPIPIVDLAAVTAIQMDMLSQLARIHNVNFNEERGKSLVTALMAASIGTMIGRMGASALKLIPGIGTVLGVGSQAVLSGASTYAVGQVFGSHFRSGGNLFNFDVTKMKDQFAEFFKEGKKVAEQKEASVSSDEIMATIAKLKELKDKGVISKEEFERTKTELLKKLSS